MDGSVYGGKDDERRQWWQADKCSSIEEQDNVGSDPGHWTPGKEKPPRRRILIVLHSGLCRMNRDLVPFNGDVPADGLRPLISSITVEAQQCQLH
jgi:hypothetical protein